MIDIRTQRIRSYEALIRWKQEDGKVLSPGLFMDIAEESGLIVQMGNWVFQEAARLARRLADQHEGNAPDIAINVSPRQLREPDMVDRLIQVMQDQQAAARLHRQWSETALIEDPRAAAEQLAALRSHGIRVCLDDFGVGYSSLSWLLDYPFDVLKIDRSFVTELPTCDRRRAVVRAVCDLAKRAKCRSSGIETEEQAAVFLELGGRFGQGYLYARHPQSGSARRVKTAPTSTSYPANRSVYTQEKGCWGGLLAQAVRQRSADHKRGWRPPDPLEYAVPVHAIHEPIRRARLSQEQRELHSCEPIGWIWVPVPFGEVR